MMTRSSAARQPTATHPPTPARGARPAQKPLVAAVLYARVSSKDKEKEGFSIPAQQKLLRAYAEEKGFIIKEEFTDIETAKKAGRTGNTNGPPCLTDEDITTLRETAPPRMPPGLPG